MSRPRRRSIVVSRGRAALASILALCLGLGVASVLTAPTASAATNEYRFVHDESGRLATVVGPTGDVARYTYDANDNITAVTRTPGAPLSLVDYEPRVAAVGAKVALVGTGFAGTSAGNTVKFGSVAAAVVSSTSRELVVTVPAGAATGTVSVTTATGTATGPSFTVTPSRAPTLAGLPTAVVTAGATVQLTGTQFVAGEAATWVAVNGVRAVTTVTSATSLSFVVPKYVSSGKVTLGTPYGRVSSKTDLIVAPAPLTPAQLDPAVRIAPETAGTSTLSTPDRSSLLLVDLPAERRATLHVGGGTLPQGWASVLAPDGRVLADRVRFTSKTFVDAVELRDAGTYTVVLTPAAGVTGTVPYVVNLLPVDVSASLSIGGGPASVATTHAGQNARVTFAGKAGQRVTTTFVKNTLTYTASLKAPDGAVLHWPMSVSGNSDRFVDTFVLPNNGSYTWHLDGTLDSVGAATVRMDAVPADTTGTMTIGGGPATVTIGAAGQNGTVTFSGTAGQRLTTTFAANTLRYSASLKAPGGTLLHSQVTVNPSVARFLDVYTLPATGTYTWLIDASGPATGTASFRMDTVPADVSASLSVDGGPVSVTVTTAGQNAKATFTGTAGQRVTTLFGSNTLNYPATLTAPDGTRIQGPASVNPGRERFVDAFVLPSTGTYTWLIDGFAESTGAATLRVDSVPPDATVTVNPDAGLVSLTTNKAGQNGAVTFPGTAGQRLTTTFGAASWHYVATLREPNGATVVASVSVQPNAKRYVDTFTLPAAGTYTWFLDGWERATGTATVRVDTVPPDATAALTIGGGPKTLTATKAGQNGRVTFPGTAGARIRTTFGANTWNYVVTLKAPSGATLHSGTSVNPGVERIVDPSALTETGTYTWILDGWVESTGSATVRVDPSTTPGSPAGAPAFPGDTTGSEPSPQTASGPAAQPGPLPAGAPTKWRVAKGRPPAFATSSGSDRAEHSPWTDVEPLTTEFGPAVAGQVLLLDGLPLPGVTVTVAESVAVTDRAGRFLVTGIPSGSQVMKVDGRTANTGTTVYGVFPVGIDVRPSGTTVLPWTTWMPVVDMSSAVQLPKVTTKKTVVKSSVPGLELHIPKGSWVEDEHGKRVSSVTLTPVPIDRPPFPLPQLGVQVPIYFTLQPGGAVVKPYGAQIIYPNYTNEPPGKRVQFWSYETDHGWEPYGYGNVTADGKRVVPEAGTRIYEFTGAMFNAGNEPPANGPSPNGTPGGDPVELATGLFVSQAVDLLLPGRVPLSATRVYRPRDSRSRSFGIGTTQPYDAFLYSAMQYSEVDFVLADGSKVHFKRTSAGTGFADAVFTAPVRNDKWSRATVVFHKEFEGWRLNLLDGSSVDFPAYTPPSVFRDPHGNEVRLHRTTGNVIDVAQTSDGRWLSFSYDDRRRITAVTDDLGRKVSYTYDAGGKLASITDPRGGVTTQTYDAAGRLATITDPRNIAWLTNTYDSADRVVTQKLADGATYGFAYTVDGTGKITATTVTDPRGVQRRVQFNGEGAVVSDTEAAGTPSQQTTTYVRQAGTGLVQSITDAAGSRSDLTYDSWGRATKLTRFAGTPSATTVSLGYTGIRNAPTKVTDELGLVTTYTYGANNALSGITDPTGAKRIYTTDVRGRLTSITSPTGAKTTLGWSLGDLVSTKDPLGHTTRFAVDAAGRQHSTTDPLGAVSRRTYDRENNLLTLVDPRGATVTATYDPGNNLTSVKTPRGGVHAYAYNARDDVSSITDPLAKAESYAYDPAGQLVKHTRRTGSVTSFGYDPLGRLVSAAAGTAVSAYGYDALGRLTSAKGPGGTTTRTYDARGNLATEAGPHGTVSYVHDAAGRRTSTQVSGQPATAVTYDAAGRPTSYTRGTAKVTVAYDAAGRRTSTTLPNGITTTYGYDAAGQLTSLTYGKGTTVLGSIAYRYDAAGRRSGMSGTYARMDLPAAVASATYDAADRLTSWGGTTLTYNANGELTGEGTRTYTWDAWGRLASVSAAGTTPAVSYGYDELDRRVRRTSGTTATTYLHDGVNPVEEQQGTARTAVFAGLGLDERYGRLPGAGQEWLLTDALNSTVALSDAAGALPTTYSYGPYGAAKAAGTASANPYQFAGREAEPHGLVYSRARFYSPGWGRFLSEDPLGLSGESANLYAYADADPVTNVDPLGLSSRKCGGGPGSDGGPAGGPGKGPRDRKPRNNDDPWDNAAREVGKEVGKNALTDFAKYGKLDPKRKLEKMDKGLKREAGKEYSGLLKDAEKTRDEGLDPLSRLLRKLWWKSNDALEGCTE